MQARIQLVRPLDVANDENAAAATGGGTASSGVVATGATVGTDAAAAVPNARQCRGTPDRCTRAIGRMRNGSFGSGKLN